MRTGKQHMLFMVSHMHACAVAIALAPTRTRTYELTHAYTIGY